MKWIIVWLSVLTLMVGAIYWYAVPMFISLIEFGKKWGG